MEEFREAHAAWERRVELAGLRGRPGDILVLADEAPTEDLRREAYRVAARSLVMQGEYGFALMQYEQLLAIDPEDLESRQQKGQILDHLRRRDVALDQASTTGELWEPRRVFLFSGHMIDAPDRPDPRFPATCEAAAAEAISSRLRGLDAGPEDLGLCSGACGGDILFAEACLALGLRLEVRIPFDERLFLERSVNFAGEQWRERYFRVKESPLTQVFVMPDELGPLPPQAEPYGRSNLWQLFTALCLGPEKLHFICLWNGEGGDGPGGTRHMHDEVVRHSGQVHVIDSKQFLSGVSR